jgi:hypothetical protein
MQKAIRLAMKNDFDISRFSFQDKRLRMSRYYIHDDGISLYSGGKDWKQYGGHFQCKHVFLGFYQLFFGTDFIDKLVGERPGCKYNIEGYCDSAPKKRYVDKCNPNCDGYGFGWRSPSYHRSKLANLKDIEAIKAYVEGLV